MGPVSVFQEPHAIVDASASDESLDQSSWTGSSSLPNMLWDSCWMLLIIFDPSPLKRTCLPLWGSWTREILHTAEDTKHEDLYSPSRTPCIWNWVHLNCGYPEPFPIHMESHRWLSKPTRQIQIVGCVSKHSELFYPSPEMTPSCWIHTRSL